MKIVCISDIHGDLLDPENIPSCDVLCISGDIVPLKMQRNLPQSISWLRKKFIKWCDNLPCQHVVMVAGNHDFCMDPSVNSNTDSIKELFEDTKIHYLLDSSVDIDGMKFYGTPWITGLSGWAFNLQDDSEVMGNIPDCDVLITHAPAAGPTGTVLQYCWNTGKDFGSESLKERLMQGGIRYCISGHIHSGEHGKVVLGEAECYNVSIKDEHYQITYPPLVLDV